MNSLPKKSNKALIVLLLVFILPVALAKLVLSLELYNGAATNKGALITPEVNYANLAMDNPKPHVWQVLFFLPETCNEQCQERLYILHQSYIALGKDRDRVTPIIVVNNSSDTKILKQLNIGFDQVNANQALATMLTEQRLVIVDPLGNLVMQYDNVIGHDANIAQGKAMIADLRKMLKLSRVG
ncbi:MAG: hypothetical protein V7771_05615 [Shewanella psychromarinicola]|jgi:hypothetical protein|uniref:Cytochrome oxidase Cu insertion factor, SCO1/SenC/PrrC family n=1 Tax=Shewanella psychromarinicola TaxID=2487742 RepID=A0A3N4E5X5_9GAMM|nr:MULTISPECIES: hypothetical protein [Shewanella]AZG34049.1 hypothetical protein EGC80_03270 [Shewanella psychromarinicola]MCL1081290.1 hypothetical protein [Shewanella psychromarinicola]PKG79058.1 hypothetical protein CXF80_12450 [Shewanella sp. Actino-trap-3]RPA32142.1 hypothetical protein EGC77_09865 [Shewanella psychromarinicola]|tara:strand:+ start:17829 stop:18380 length:552 start_codon:yes stop_codon:yes gene_type:complete